MAVSWQSTSGDLSMSLILAIVYLQETKCTMESCFLLSVEIFRVCPGGGWPQGVTLRSLTQTEGLSEPPAVC